MQKALPDKRQCNWSKTTQPLRIDGAAEQHAPQKARQKPATTLPINITIVAESIRAKSAKLVKNGWKKICTGLKKVSLNAYTLCSLHKLYNTTCCHNLWQAALFFVFKYLEQRVNVICFIQKGSQPKNFAIGAILRFLWVAFQDIVVPSAAPYFGLLDKPSEIKSGVEHPTALQRMMRVITGPHI